MSVEIKPNPKLVLEIPGFSCDNNPLGEHLNAYEMLSHLNSYSMTAIIGKPGSGKTSLLISMLTGKGNKRVFRKVFDHILVVMPSSSRNSIKKNPFKNHDAGKLYEELNYDTITAIYAQLKASTDEGEKTLLVLDDVGAVLKNKEIGKLLRQIIYNRRHLKVHIVVLLQSYLSIPKEVRKLITNCFLFKPSKIEFENFCDELFETKKETAIEIMRVAYDKPELHQYIMLNVNAQKMYRNFDEIIVKEAAT